MADAAAKPAPAAKAAPAKSDREKQLEAELSAVRGQLAQAHEARKRETRSGDPASEHYDPEYAQELAWPSQVRDEA